MKPNDRQLIEQVAVRGEIALVEFAGAAVSQGNGSGRALFGRRPVVNGGLEKRVADLRHFKAQQWIARRVASLAGLKPFRHFAWSRRAAGMKMAGRLEFGDAIRMTW